MSEQQKKVVEAISEKTLDEVAGGLKLDKATVKKALIAAGVLVLGTGVVGVSGLAIAGSKGHGPMKGFFNKGTGAATATETESETTTSENTYVGPGPNGVFVGPGYDGLNIPNPPQAPKIK